MRRQKAWLLRLVLGSACWGGCSGSGSGTPAVAPAAAPVVSALPVAAVPVPVTAIEPRVAQNFDEPHGDERRGTPSDYRTFTYAQHPSGPLELFVFEPKRAAPSRNAAILLFHSGGWTRGRPEWLFGLAKQFSSLGLVAVPVRYRLSKDGITPIDAMADACAAFRWVREHASELQIDSKRVAGWGASAGGQLVASGATVGCAGESATSGSADALILVSAGVDVENSQQFRKLVGEGVDPKRYSPLAHVRPGIPPTFLVKGVEDNVTLLASTERFCQKISDVGGSCQLRSFPELGHLLTRALDDQRTRLDPDPNAEAEAYRAEVQFLRKIGFVSAESGVAATR